MKYSLCKSILFPLLAVALSGCQPAKAVDQAAAPAYQLGERLPDPKAAPPTPAAAAAPVKYREIAWDELMPQDWDPLKRFQNINLGVLNDGDPRADQLLRDMRAAFDNAPLVTALDGHAIKVPGFIVPLEEAKGGLSEFLLVPYFGGCIHTPPPPANQIIHVTASTPAKGFRTMDAVWVSGVMKTRRKETMMGTSGYELGAVVIEKYEDKRERGGNK